jgi:hypothetical protein
MKHTKKQTVYKLFISNSLTAHNAKILETEIDKAAVTPLTSTTFFSSLVQEIQTS